MTHHPPTETFQTEVARLALAVASRHGFALAGGHALIAHGIVSRPTEDVDLFTNLDTGVRDAANQVCDALVAAGLDVEPVQDGGLGDLFDGFDDDLTEFEVRRGSQAVRLQLVRFDRRRTPVILGPGPVLHLDDVLGAKVAALVARAQPRDYIDIAAALDHYSRHELVACGRRADPTLADDEFAAAMRRLDELPDEVFALYQLDAHQTRTVRARFTDWPR